MGEHGIPELYRLAVPSVAELIFGLDWFAIIGTDASTQAQRLAHRYRASHLAVGQFNASCAGLVSMGDTSSGMPLCAAALLVAGRYSERSVGLVCELKLGLWWMVAVHDGAVVTRSDRLFSTQRQATEALNELCAFYPGLSFLELGKGSELAASLQNDQISLCRIHPYRMARRRRQRRVLLAGGLVITLSGLLVHLLMTRHPTPAVVDHQNAEEARRAWEQAQREALKQHWLHGTNGTVGILRNLYRQPVDLAGWQLQSVECVSRRAMWRCESLYLRQALGASNQGFLDVAPDHWRISFTPLEQARADWTVQSLGKSLDQAHVDSSSMNEARLFSHLQGIRPALPTVAISASVPLVISAPLDEEGQPQKWPADLPRYGLRNIEFRAPLRSASLLIPYVEHIAWERVVLTLSEQTRPSVAHSVLMAQLKGVLYETED